MFEVAPRTQSLRDGEMKVTGQIPYALDVDLPGMTYARCVRSPYAHARIVSIDKTRALAVPGVVLVLTRDDLTDDLFHYYGAAFKDQPIVAIDKARHVGDIVAAVLAEWPDAAAEAAELVEVEYEELPAVFDAVEALKPGAPVVHETISGYDKPAAAGLSFQDGTNLINHMKVRKGDVEQGFREADIIHEDVFNSPALHHCALEPHVTVAQWEDDDLTIWSSTQMPYFVRQQVADVFRLPVERVRVLVYTLGGGYGAKTYARMEPLAAVLAYKAQRPVKLMLARAEEFVTTTKHEAQVRLKTGLKHDGTITAREVEVYYNAGAYADRSGTIARSGGIGATGPYRIPHVKVDAYAAYTNRPNAVPFRGLAVSQVAWAYERHTDEIARRLGRDPLEYRRQVLLREGDRFATSEELADVHFVELLDDAAEAIGYEEPLPAPSTPEKTVGRGVAAIIKHMGSNPATTQLEIRLHADGTIEALSSTVDIGQGSRTVLSREVARALGVPEERVDVPYVETGATPPDQGTSSSRSSFFNVLAARAAAEDLAEQLKDLASKAYEVPAESVEVRQGRVLLGTRGQGSGDGESDAERPHPNPLPKGEGASRSPHPIAPSPRLASNAASPHRPLDSVEMADLLKAAGVPSLTGSGGFKTDIWVDPETGQGKASHHWHQAAAGAIVEVDRETGKVTLLKLHLSTHAGRVIDRANAELQNEGCSAFGLSQALFEEMLFDGGQVTNPNLSDYNIAAFTDFPLAFSTTLAENPEPDAEVHGLGETGLPAVPPAIGNAVRDAIGVAVRSIPLTPERVLGALRGAERAQGGVRDQGLGVGEARPAGDSRNV